MNMKRRNAECGKLRRPVKRSKITEGFYGSTFLYIKFLVVWILVLMADFILEFRFEYLWPFWLLLRSVYDSFKFQGLAFSIFFVIIALTSDMICYLFIPVHWLFFAASTYVWVQYVWHTERGICLPTVSLWLLFVYIEASIRLREIKNSVAASAFSFNLDLCRPFAAHCIGYPVVTLGFGFKSYVGYRMRQRKQKDVSKENEFYMQLLQQALPSDSQNPSETDRASDSPSPSSVSASSLPSSHSVPSSSSNSSFFAGSPGQQSKQAEANNNSTWSSWTTLWPSWSSWGTSNSTSTSKSSSAVDESPSTPRSSSNPGASASGNNSSCSVGKTASSGRGGTGWSGGFFSSLFSSSTANSQKLKGHNESSAGAANKNPELNGNCVGGGGGVSGGKSNPASHQSSSHSSSKSNYQSNANNGAASASVSTPHHKRCNSIDENDFRDIFKIPTSPKTPNNARSVNDFDETVDNIINDEAVNNAATTSSKTFKSTVSTTSSSKVAVGNNKSSTSSSAASSNSVGKKKSNKQENSLGGGGGNNFGANNYAAANSPKGGGPSSSLSQDFVYRLEADVKRLKADLQASRQTEADLRAQVNSLSVGDRTMKSELSQIQSDNDALQSKLHNLVTSRQADKLNLASMEKKLVEERKNRQNVENQLSMERAKKKSEEQAAARAIALAAAAAQQQQQQQRAGPSGDASESANPAPCDTDNCKHREELEAIREDLKRLRQERAKKEDDLRHLETEAAQLRQYKDNGQSETEVLMSALAAMQDKIAQLENSLSSETRLKQDLFSALGESKRQFANEMMRKNQEISELKSRIAEVMALIPQPSSFPSKLDSPGLCGGGSGAGGGGAQFSKFCPTMPTSSPPPLHHQSPLASMYPTPQSSHHRLGAIGGGVPGGLTSMGVGVQGLKPDSFTLAQASGQAGGSSKLDPNACIYMPKMAAQMAAHNATSTSSSSPTSPSAPCSTNGNVIISKPKMSQSQS